MVKKACNRIKVIPSRCFKSFEKQEPHEDTDCANCWRQLLRKPLIRGFVKIAKSKIFLRKASKLIVFFICTTGFVYQTWAFLQIYLTYPTVQDISEEYPEKITAPAITICNNNRYFRQRFCKTYPWQCEWKNTTTWNEFCETHKRQCTFIDGKWYEWYDFNFAVPNYYSEILTDRSSTVLNAIGPQREEDLITSCSMARNESYDSCNSSIMIQATKNGYPYKCFSLLSLLGNGNKEPLQLSLTDEYSIILEMHPEEYIDDSDLVQAFVVIHDPRKLVNPMTEGVALPAGKLYKLYPTMVKKVSLPPPFDSNCMDYLKEWKKNGGYGPLSKKDCIDLCLINAMVDKYDCVVPETKYPNNYNVCKYSSDVCTPEMIKKCYGICRDGCEENTYRFTSEIMRDNSPAASSSSNWQMVKPMTVSVINCHPKDEYCICRYLEIQVSFIRMTIETFLHIPRFESVELFSYIGGYLGMWLGISLAYLFDFVEMIYDVVHLFLKGKGKRKMITPIEKFRRRTT